MTTRQVLAELGKITAAFLLENGGMANGYDTRVTGTLRRNATGALEVFTPTCRKKTYEDVAKLGRELESRRPCGTLHGRSAVLSRITSCMNIIPWDHPTTLCRITGTPDLERGYDVERPLDSDEACNLFAALGFPPSNFVWETVTGVIRVNRGVNSVGIVLQEWGLHEGTMIAFIHSLPALGKVP